jgi:AcrR family transcriptional regulator
MDTREIIVNTAFKVFMQEGFDNVSLNTLIKSTGLSKGAFYHHFSSKSELINEIVDSYLIKYVDSYLLGMDKISKDLNLSSMFNRFFEQIGSIKYNLSPGIDSDDDLRAFFLLLFSALKRDDELLKKYNKLKNEFTYLMRNILTEAYEHNQLREDVDIISTANNIYMIFRGVMYEWAIAQEGELEELLKDNIDNIVKMIRK